MRPRGLGLTEPLRLPAHVDLARLRLLLVRTPLELFQALFVLLLAREESPPSALFFAEA